MPQFYRMYLQLNFEAFLIKEQSCLFAGWLNARGQDWMKSAPGQVLHSDEVSKSER